MRLELTTVIAAGILSTLVLLSPIPASADSPKCQSKLDSCLDRETSVIEEITGAGYSMDTCWAQFQDCILKR